MADVDSCIYYFINKDNIYDIMVDYGTYENLNNITMLRINILLNKGFWGNQDIINEENQNIIINKLFETFNNKNYLKKDDINLNFYHPIKILFSESMKFSDSEKENINKLLWDEFQLNYAAEIYETHCEVYIIDTIDLDNFVIFMENIFGNDVIIDL
jgi:hypothetical protein